MPYGRSLLSTSSRQRLAPPRPQPHPTTGHKPPPGFPIPLSYQSAPSTRIDRRHPAKEVTDARSFDPTTRPLLGQARSVVPIHDNQVRRLARSVHLRFGSDGGDSVVVRKKLDFIARDRLGVATEREASLHLDAITNLQLAGVTCAGPQSNRGEPKHQHHSTHHLGQEHSPTRCRGSGAYRMRHSGSRTLECNTPVARVSL